jgi:ribosomal protein S18 acetylase RimI-like enzyme
MAPLIRKMVVRDLVDAKNLDSVCWADLMQKSYGIRTSLPQRTDENVLSFLHTDPAGAFVAEDEQAGIVGTCFSHVWGNTGWVGPLSVLPSYQSRGIGKELLRASLAYLEDQGCVDIGLETMPESATNLGMYLKVGLRPEGLVVVLGRKLDQAQLEEEPSGAVTVQMLSESDVKSNLMRQMKAIANSLRFGLDYSVEIELAEKFSFGDTIVAISGGKVVGFSVVHTKHRRENQSGASIKILAVDPNSKESVLEPIVATAELVAADAGCAEITIPIPVLSRRALDSVFSRGYVVSRTFERLMWIGSSGINEQNCNLCSWSG